VPRGFFGQFAEGSKIPIWEEACRWDTLKFLIMIPQPTVHSACNPQSLENGPWHCVKMVLKYILHITRGYIVKSTVIIEQ
jgi:hypothetical protein